MLKENTSFVKASKSPLARLSETSVFLKHLSLSMDPSGGVSLEIGQFRINGARGAKNVHSMQAAAPNPEKCAHTRIIARL